MSTLVTISGSCPLCGHALKLCQAKAGPLYLGCSTFPRCTFRCAYDPVLQRLRDENAKLHAQLALLEMQRQARPTGEDAPSSPEERRRGLTTWPHVAYRWTPEPGAEPGEMR